LQHKIVSIIWMVPIYSLESWLSLRFAENAAFLDMVRDCYEAYVVYIFFSLCICYITADSADQVPENTTQIERVLQEKQFVSHPPPLSHCLPPINLVSGSKRFVLRCKFNILQFVVVKPICTGTAWMLSLCGNYMEGEIDFRQAYIYIAFVDNISVSFAMYFLVLFYLAIESALAEHAPLYKLMCIKCVVLFSWWQGIILAILCKVDLLPNNMADEKGESCHELATSIQNSVIVVEMLFLSVIHLRVWSAAHYKFRQCGQNTSNAQPLTTLLPFNGQHLRRDLREVTPTVLPAPFRPPIAEQRMYVPPAADPSPLQTYPSDAGEVSMAALPISSSVDSGQEACSELDPH